MNKKLSREFFALPADIVAPSLLGQYLCVQKDGLIKKFMITETECYIGTEDTACHAHAGKTKRTEVMWKDAGTIYIYLCYGIHNMLNIVCYEEGYPQAVLIRGLQGLNGPGKLTKVLGIDKSFNNDNILSSNRIWIEKGKPIEYICTPRIGIDYASKEDRERLWRFVIKEK